MPDPRRIAETYGVAVSVEDLGDWGEATLVSEYDPQGPVIRINARAIERLRQSRGGLDSCDVRRFIDVAIAHELHHHREAIGDVPRAPDRGARERDAAAYAAAITAESEPNA